MKRKFLVCLLSLLLLIVIQVIFSQNVEATTVNELRNKFPTGKFWNHYSRPNNVNNPDGYTNEPCTNHDGTVGNPDCNLFNGGEQCAGFARKLFFDYYGEMPYEKRIGNYDKNALKAGDLLRYNGEGAYSGGHEVWIIGVNGDELTVAECNWWPDNYGKCNILWDRVVHKSLINIQYVCPAPYEINDNKDTTSPVIEDVYIPADSMTGSSYKLYVKASDNVGVLYARVYSWEAGKDEDKYKKENRLESRQTNSNGYYEFTIEASDSHNGYKSNIAVYDTSMNRSDEEILDIPINSTIDNSFKEFTARIVSSENSSLVVGTAGNENRSNVLLKTKDIGNQSQIWKFTPNNDKTYTITNLASGRKLDIDGGGDGYGANAQLYDSNSSTAQKFYIMKYYNGYRLVPKCTKTLKALDIYRAVFVNNQNIQLWDVAGQFPNPAQRWIFENVPTSINLSSTEITVEKDSTENLTATLDLNDSALVWSSSDTSVATVSNGIVTGKKVGTATITAYPENRTDLVATCKVTVTNVATDFSLSSSKYQINSLTERPQLIATLDTGAKAKVTWSSSNEEVATVDSNGVVTPIRGGFVHITATSERFGKKDCWIYVCTLISLSDGSKAYAGDLDRDGRFTSLDASMILDIYKDGSSNKKILADIDGNGVVTANDASIILDLYKYGNDFHPGKYNPIQNITLNKNDIELEKEKNLKLTATYTPLDTTDSPNLTWTSNNEKVATVDSTGKVTAKRAGKAIITVKTSNNKSATCNVTVPGLVYTTIPTEDASKKEVMIFKSKTGFESILTSDNFPILDSNYKVELYDSSNKIKENTNKVGSKNTIKIKDTDGNVVAEYMMVVKGDVTGNGYSRMYDAFQILKDSLFNGNLDDVDMLIRDYDGNGYVRMYDAFQFLKDSLFN